MNNIFNIKSLLLSTALLLSTSSHMMASFALGDDDDGDQTSLVGQFMGAIIDTVITLPTEDVKTFTKTAVDAIDTNVPGAKVAYKALNTLHSLTQSGDEERNKDTVARLVGNKAKNIVRNMPLIGEQTVEALEMVTPSGHNSATENVLNKMTFGLGRIKIDNPDADASEITGEFAQKAVKRIPLIGGYIAEAGEAAG